MNNEKNNSEFYPPVVVVLGHVDHGKTSILDYIRKTRVVDKESGGITQHIGAYQVESNGKKITFIDTPGHEAFSAMRSRGANVADIAVLVVAAEEGIKPQTLEAIKHIKEARLPLIVAINKMDKSGALPEKVKQELARKEVLAESMGGKVPMVLTSAKTGQGIDDLLDVILILAELENIQFRLSGSGKGVIIESHLDTRRGATATLLISEGEVKKGDLIWTSSTGGVVKIMEDFQGSAISFASAGTPVLICGFYDVPGLGDEFEIMPDEMALKEKMKEAASKIFNRPATKKNEENGENGKKSLHLILKTDVTGSIEAIKGMIDAIEQDEVKIEILRAEAGEVNESDIKLAESANAKIIGFNTKISARIAGLAERNKVSIRLFDIIYELIQAIRDLVAKRMAPDIIRENLGKLKVVAVFRNEPPRMIVGGKVTEGVVARPAQIEILRDKEKVGQGRLIELQRNKKEADEVSKGQEAGILFDGNGIIEIGDTLVFYREKKQKKEL